MSFDWSALQTPRADREAMRIFSVFDNGADATGNVSAAVQATITKAGVYSIVLFPPKAGGYLVSGLTVEYERQLWIGAGLASPLISAGGRILQVTTAGDYFRAKDMTFYGDASAADNVEINGIDCVLEDVWSTNCGSGDTGRALVLLGNHPTIRGGRYSVLTNAGNPVIDVGPNADDANDYLYYPTIDGIRTGDNTHPVRLRGVGGGQFTNNQCGGLSILGAGTVQPNVVNVHGNRILGPTVIEGSGHTISGNSVANVTFNGGGFSANLCKFRNNSVASGSTITNSGNSNNIIEVAETDLTLSGGARTMTTSSGAPAHAAPEGSVHWRTDAANGNIYVRRNGSWTAVLA